MPSAGSASVWEWVRRVVWAGKSSHHLSLKDRRAVAAEGVYGVLAALLNDGPVAFSWDHSGRPAKPAADSGIGVVLAPSISHVPGPTGLGAIFASVSLRLAVRQAVDRRVIHIPQGTGQALRDAFKRGRWPGVQYALLWRPWLREPLGNARSEMLWRAAITEALVFAQAHFDLGWCEHGKHWYVRKDVRQMDCPRHKKAGQQARWWRWARRHRQARAAK